MFCCAVKSSPVVLLVYFVLTFYVLYQPVQTNNDQDFLLLTVATEETDGYNRFIRSTNVYNVPTKVLGMGLEWEGGDMSRPGGGHKIVLVKEALQQYADDKNKIVMFTDSYDVIILGSPSAILEQFRSLDARIIFAAEPYCWPDQTLADKYPVTESRYKYLNSGGVIGYASDLYELLSEHKVSSGYDDQLFYTKLYLDKALRDRFRMKLDHKAAIFQNLYGTADDVDIVEGALVNMVHGSRPLVLHGNGLSKLTFNSLANYLAHSWTKEEGCVTCRENNIDLSKIAEDEYPTILIALHVTIPSPFIREFFDKIIQLDYPKNKITFFVYNGVEYHNKDVKQFIENVKNIEQYSGIKEIKSEDDIKEADARTLAVNYCLTTKCEYLLSADSIAHLDNPATLKDLIFLNRTIIAPLIARHKKAWSNFWGELTKDGYYARSFDYMDIVNNDRRGVWNVPYVSSVYLINSTILHRHKPKYLVPQLDSDMAFCKSYRDKGVFMYVANVDDYGHLVDPEGFNTSRVHPDMYEHFTNQLDWEKRFISPLYQDNFKPDNKPEQPCPDVYWFPVVSPEFCQNLIDIMENFGKWSDGTNTDNRLVGGYENVPTRDLHMNQVGLEPMWMEFLKLFVRPLQEHVFIGYFHDDPRIDGGYENVPTRDVHMTQVGLDHVWDEFLSSYVSPLQQAVFIGYYDPPRSLMNFVVRYRPDEQPSLRPHHDSSTYTINLALNRPEIDYQGGGCMFLRYNCSVTQTRVGWLLMHPGRLTHFHEGLPVTNGTRYIMISFVDP